MPGSHDGCTSGLWQVWIQGSIQSLLQDLDTACMELYVGYIKVCIDVVCVYL